MTDGFAESFLAQAEEADAEARYLAGRARLAARAAQSPSAVNPEATISPTPGERSDAPANSPEKPERSWGRAVFDTAVDLTTQPAAGAMQAVGELAGSLNDLGNWLNENVADLTVDLGSTGSETADAAGRALLGNPLASLEANLTENLPARTTAGEIVRGVSQFLTGFAINRAALGGLGMPGAVGTRAGYAKATAAGAMTDAFAFDPQAGNLANLIESVPALANPVTQFLAAAPDDSAALARLKNAVTGLIPGVMVDGLVAGIRFYRARAVARGAQTAAGGADSAAAGAVAPTASALDDVKAAGLDADLATLGPRDGPLFAPEPTPPAEIEPIAVLPKNATDAEIDAAIAAAPPPTTTQALGAQVKAGAASLDQAKEGVAAIQDTLARLKPDEMDRMLERLRSADGKPGVREPERFATWTRRQGGVKDESGELSAFLGKGRAGGLINNKSGMSFDRWIERAYEDGWTVTRGGLDDVDRLDPSEAITSDQLQELLRRDVAGQPVYRPDDPGSQAFLAEGEALDGLQRALDEAGIDLATTDNPAALRKLEEFAEAKVREAATLDGPPVDGPYAGGYEVHPDEAPPPPDGAPLPRNPLAEEGLMMPGGFRVNLNRVTGRDELKAVVAEQVRRNADPINVARRGKVTLAETRANADQLNAFEILIKRQNEGGALRDDELTAMKDLWVSSTAKLLAVAQRAAANPSEGALLAYSKMEAFHLLIQQEFFGARAEVARAFSALRIPSGVNAGQMRQIEQILAEAGGPEVLRAKAEKLAAIAKTGNPLAVEKFIEKSARATTMEMVQEAYVNGLLWLPTTHAANFLSNGMVLAQSVYERWSAGKLAQVVGAADGVQPGEAAAMLDGISGSFRDALRMAWGALKSGEADPFGLGGKVEFGPKITSGGMGLDEGSLPGALADTLGATVRAPGRALGAADTFYKVLNYRAAVHAYAVREAAGLGITDPKALAAKVADLVNNPPEHIKLSSQDDALLNTFTNKVGDWGQAMLLARAKVPPLTFVIPFVKTPVNISRYAFERNPLTAPFVRQWREDMAAPGARRQLAIARTATGAMVLGTAMDLADRGLITGAGPDDPGERAALQRQGWKPYSMKIGDRWHSYQRMDPIGMTLGFAADFAELNKRYEIEPEEMDSVNEALAAAIFAISQTTVNKTYLSGLSQAVDAIANPDMAGPSYVAKFTGSFIPIAVSGVERLVDPTIRDTSGLGEYLQSRIAGLSDRLQPALDLWGDEKTGASGLGWAYDAVSPIASSKIKDSPADREMRRLNLNIQDIPRKLNFEGVPVDLGDYPRVRHDYRKLAGNALKGPDGRGARDAIAEMVQGQGPRGAAYQRLPDGEGPGTKGGAIANVIDQYRQAALRAIWNDPGHKEFREFIEAQREARRARAQEAAER